MPRPMPSPRGTNIERAFLPSGSPVAAYDADTTDPTPMLKMFLAKLSDDDKAVLRQLLDGDSDAGEMPSTAMDAAARARQSYDPEAGKSFEERFPNSKRFLS